MTRRVRFAQRWAMVQMTSGRARLLSAHWTVGAAVQARDTRRRRSAPGARFRVVPTIWAPPRRLAAFITMELIRRGPSQTTPLVAAGVLPRYVVTDILAGLSDGGLVVYVVPREAAEVAAVLTAVGLVDDPSEIGRWRLNLTPGQEAAAMILGDTSKVFREVEGGGPPR